MTTQLQASPPEALSFFAIGAGMNPHTSPVRDVLTSTAQGSYSLSDTDTATSSSSSLQETTTSCLKETPATAETNGSRAGDTDVAVIVDTVTGSGGYAR